MPFKTYEKYHGQNCEGLQEDNQMHKCPNCDKYFSKTEIMDHLEDENKRLEQAYIDAQNEGVDDETNPVFIYFEGSTKDTECQICCVDYQEGDRIKNLHCLHPFH